jgi:hypothetical protein
MWKWKADHHCYDWKAEYKPSLDVRLHAQEDTATMQALLVIALA